MKILLIKPYPELKVAKQLQQSFLHLEPLELEIVAAGVPEEDEVRILDLSIEKNPKDTFTTTLLDYKPDLVGFSAYSTTFQIVKDLAKKTKQLLANVTVAVGGIHATLLPQDFYINEVDYVIRGEGATAIAKLIKSIKGGLVVHNEYILNTKSEEYMQTAKKNPPPYVSVEDIPLPRRDLVDRSKYFCVWTHSDERKLDTMFPTVASLRTSLGCPFSCSFCVIHHVMNKKYLQRDPVDVVDEIENLDENYIYFVDDEMFINVDRVRKIAQLLKERNVKKKYISWARSDTIVAHPEIFELWKTVGLDVVYVGLESMDEEKLKEYDKKAGVETNKKAIEILRKLDITLHAAFIVHPDFSPQDFRRLEKTVLDLCPAEVTFTVLSPSPGTPYWHENKDRFICDPFKNYDCMHTILPTKLSLQRFYQHFGRLSALALRSNPMRINKIKVPFKDFVRAMIGGTKYIFSLYTIYKDYPPKLWLKSDDELLKLAQEEN